MAKRISINKKSKVDKTSALVDDCLLRFDMIVKWEVKDLCYWLDAIEIPEAKEHFQMHGIDGQHLIRLGTEASSVPKDIKALKRNKSKRELLTRYIKELEKEVQARANGQVPVTNGLRENSMTKTAEAPGARQSTPNIAPSAGSPTANEEDVEFDDSDEWSEEDELYQNPPEQQPPVQEPPPPIRRAPTPPTAQPPEEDLPPSSHPPPPIPRSGRPTVPPSSDEDEDNGDYVIPTTDKSDNLNQVTKPPMGGPVENPPPPTPPTFSVDDKQSFGRAVQGRPGRPVPAIPSPHYARPTNNSLVDDKLAPTLPPVFAGRQPPPGPGRTATPPAPPTSSAPPIPAVGLTGTGRPLPPTPAAEQTTEVLPKRHRELPPTPPDDQSAPPLPPNTGRRAVPSVPPPLPAAAAPSPAVPRASLYEETEDTKLSPPSVPVGRTGPKRPLPSRPPDDQSPPPLPPTNGRKPVRGALPPIPASHSHPPPAVPAPPTDEVYEITDDTPPPLPTGRAVMPPPVPKSHPVPASQAASAARDDVYEITDEQTGDPQEIYEVTDSYEDPPEEKKIPPPLPTGRAVVPPPVPKSHPVPASQAASATRDDVYEITDEPPPRPLPSQPRRHPPPAAVNEDVYEPTDTGPPPPPPLSRGRPSPPVSAVKPSTQPASSPPPAPASKPAHTNVQKPLVGIAVGARTIKEKMSKLRPVTNMKLFPKKQEREDEDENDAGDTTTSPTTRVHAPRVPPVSSVSPAPASQSWQAGGKSTLPGSPQCVVTSDQGPPGSPPVGPSATPAQASHPLAHCPWFFGKLHRDIATQKVRELRQEGAFLVRESEQGGSGFPYTLCVLHHGEPYNIQIRKREDRKFALGSRKEKETIHSTVEDLIKFHQNNALEVTSKNRVTGSVVLGVSPAK